MQPKKDSVTSQPKGEDMNFSMFGSIKSDHSDMVSVKSKKDDNNNSVNFDDFMNKSEAPRESAVSVKSRESQQ